MKLIACNSNPELSKSISKYLDIPLSKASFRRFSDGEIHACIDDNVRGEDVFVIQSTCNPVNDNLMELLICIDALRRSSARRVTAVIPYFGYARQDRKTGGRTPITAKLVANIIERSGADRVLTMDLHAGQIQGFFDIPTDNLWALPVITADVLTKYGKGNVCVVSPDVGGVVRARELSARVGGELAIVDKRRPEAGKSEVMNIIGDVKDRDCIIVDDMIDSGGTLCNAAKAIMDKGAKSVSAYASHGVFSAEAHKRINESVLTEVVVSDTIPVKDGYDTSTGNIRYITVAPLIGEAIRRIANEESVSNLFK